MEEQHQTTRRAVSISADGIVAGSGADNPSFGSTFVNTFTIIVWLIPGKKLPDRVKRSGSVNDFKINYDN